MMKRVLLLAVIITTVATAVGCKSNREWSETDRRAVRDEIREYRDMVYLENLADAEFDIFSGDVVTAIEGDYPVYTTFVEMPGQGDTIEVYVVSTIVERLNADAHNMRNIYPYPMLVAEGILPNGLDRQAQRAFYECFARKVKAFYPSTQSFFNAVINDDSSTSQLTQFQEQCASDLFDWVVEVDETIFFN